MTVLTAAEELLADTHPQRTQLYLSIYQPDLVMIAQVTGTYDASNQTIGFYNTVSGSYSEIPSYYFYTVLVGSAPNLDDYGRTWVRSITASDIRFVESDHIDWQSGLWLTVLKYVEITSLFPRIIQDPANDEDVIFYKVWDIAYTDQNSTLGTFINMGSHYAGFTDEPVYWTSSGTTNLLGEALTYLWAFEGGTPTGSVSAVPGNVSYASAGHYQTTLKTTASSGRIDIAQRNVSLYDRPGQGPNTPILNWELTEYSGSRKSYGYTARIKIRENVPKTLVRDGAQVTIFGEDWYGSTKQSLSKNDAGRSKIKLVGYIADESITYNYQDGSVEFTVVSPTGIMELCECFSVSVESKTAPTKWYELLNMTVKRALYHYLAWHSTVLRCCDFSANFDDRNIQYFDADRTSLFDAINSLMSGALVGSVVSDSLGKLWAERDYTVINNAASTLPIAATFSKGDWIGNPNIDKNEFESTSFIEMGGIAYEPLSNAFDAFLASAPGSAPGYRGRVERIQGLALTNQAELNTLVGNLYANQNADYPSVGLKLRSNFQNLDIAPQAQVKLNVAATDTPRGIVWSNKSFSLESVGWSWDARTQLAIPDIDLSEIMQGYAGTTIIIPDVPPTAAGNTPGQGGSYSQPPLITPPLPTATSITTGTSNIWGRYTAPEQAFNSDVSSYDFPLNKDIPLVAAYTDPRGMLNADDDTYITICENGVYELQSVTDFWAYGSYSAIDDLTGAKALSGLGQLWSPSLSQILGTHYSTDQRFYWDGSSLWIARGQNIGIALIRLDKNDTVGIYLDLAAGTTAPTVNQFRAKAVFTVRKISD
jgi:hypothetical protein